MNKSRVLTILSFSVLTALAVISNQYVRWGRAVTVALLIVGSVGSSLVGTMWAYHYFYHG